MARKRKTDEPEGGVGIADPPTETPAADAQAQPPPAAGEASAPLSAPLIRPAASYAAHSDRTTRIEVAVWARPVKVAEGEEYTQYSLSFSRGWKDTDGQWRDAAYYRAHDVPVLLYLTDRAYQWCLAQRAMVRVEPDGDVPL